ncbi:hypothetical protein QYE76_063587 [Lolium multiflorum]|uniref:CCHC-type domain-containing protein n=1 Tax=Lolium multiflorum TaxID=4521 RepID=A0AAD8W9G0_LOLMU|nr:hypothetical protein QYE76_063587 [Lolium multiflorum]
MMAVKMAVETVVEMTRGNSRPGGVPEQRLLSPELEFRDGGGSGWFSLVSSNCVEILDQTQIATAVTVSSGGSGDDGGDDDDGDGDDASSMTVMMASISPPGGDFRRIPARESSFSLVFSAAQAAVTLRELQELCDELQYAEHDKELPELFGMLKAAEIEIKKEHQVLMVNKTTSFKKQGKSKGKFKKGGKKAATPPMKPKNGPKPDAECYYCKEKGHLEA